MVTAHSSRRLLLVVEIVEVVEEIVERVAAGIISCSTVVTALSSRRLLLVVEVVEVVEEIVERVAEYFNINNYVIASNGSVSVAVSVRW